MQVVGLGTQDDFEFAKRFAATHELTIPMVWDPGFDSWRHYDILGQPAYVLVSAEGKVVAKDFGMWPDDILDRLP